VASRPLSPDILDVTLKAVVAARGNVSVAARNLELPIGTVSARVKMLIRLKMLDLEALRNGPKTADSPATSATATESFEVSGDSAELFTSVPERVQSLEDLIRVGGGAVRLQQVGDGQQGRGRQGRDHAPVPD
jgi:hypothetical protein